MVESSHTSEKLMQAATASFLELNSIFNYFSGYNKGLASSNSIIVVFRPSVLVATTRDLQHHHSRVPGASRVNKIFEIVNNQALSPNSFIDSLTYLEVASQCSHNS
ncbi:hypothetical protein POM88_018114 [Heracleum sosnowskyi]|uniref:Uncharacterized protein n=1 Tax=Heracleum sosnowskyi TaxID=360622 RepID=A0AAD8ITS3_9APIA|nr:hypothetical protein POM88_018098 [Heracleum sosnowskyi]KAK1389936.1 hypothetical protein POM88_018114 [Heracleum sosnowskyi]